MRGTEVPLTDPDPVSTTERPRLEPGDRWRPWRVALAVVVVTHLAFVALAWAGSYFLSHQQGDPSVGVTELWRRWDTEHYIDIAEHGYDSPATTHYAEAFFPLYPLAIRSLAWTGLDPVILGMAISAAASVVALAYLYRLAEEDLYPGAGRRAVLLLGVFPTAVFLTAAYSEALFLAGAIAAFFYARRRDWRLVALPAAVALGTRIAGVFLLLGLAAEFIRQREWDRRKVLTALGAAAIAVVPLVAYMAYLWRSTGDPFYFFTAQANGWHRELTDPRAALERTWQTFYGDYAANWLAAWRVEVFAAVAGAAFTVWAFVRREFGYGVYMGTLMIPLLASSWYLSIPRMLLSMFPIPILIAGVTRDEQRHTLVVSTFAVFAALGVLVFTQGLWFF